MWIFNIYYLVPPKYKVLFTSCYVIFKRYKVDSDFVFCFSGLCTLFIVGTSNLILQVSITLWHSPYHLNRFFFSVLSGWDWKSNNYGIIPSFIKSVCWVLKSSLLESSGFVNKISTYFLDNSLWMLSTINQ